MTLTFGLEHFGTQFGPRTSTGSSNRLSVPGSIGGDSWVWPVPIGSPRMWATT